MRLGVDNEDFFNIFCYISGYLGTHAVQGHLLPNLGRFVLGEGLGFRGVDEVQEADQRSAIRFEPDSQPSFHPVVVTDNQPCQRLRRFPGATGFNRNFHARKDPHAQDLPHPDLQGAFVAKGELTFYLVY